MTDPLDQLPPDRLAALLAPHPAAPPWSDADGIDAFHHQLAAPLLPDLLLAPVADSASLTPFAAQHTFRSALTSADTPLLVLATLKHFARLARETADSPLAGSPGTLLYYAAIAAALRQGHRITSLSDAQLRDGFTWCLAQPAAADLHPLFRSAL